MTISRYLERVAVVKGREEQGDFFISVVNGRRIVRKVSKRPSKQEAFERAIRKMQNEWTSVNKSVIWTGIIIGEYTSEEGREMADLVIEETHISSDREGPPVNPEVMLGKKVKIFKSWILYGFGVDIEELLTHSNENVRQLARARYNRLYAAGSNSST